SGVAITGQYTNIGTATGHDSFLPSTTVTATNPDNYFGDVAHIQIVKFANGADVDCGHVLVGTNVTFTYDVTATGSNVPIANVVVRDDNATPANPADDFTPTLISGDINSNGLLDAGETWHYSA